MTTTYIHLTVKQH